MPVNMSLLFTRYCFCFAIKRDKVFIAERLERHCPFEPKEGWNYLGLIIKEYEMQQNEMKAKCKLARFKFELKYLKKEGGFAYQFRLIRELEKEYDVIFGKGYATILSNLLKQGTVAIIFLESSRIIEIDLEREKLRSELEKYKELEEEIKKVEELKNQFIEQIIEIAKKYNVEVFVLPEQRSIEGYTLYEFINVPSESVERYVDTDIAIEINRRYRKITCKFDTCYWYVRNDILEAIKREIEEKERKKIERIELERQMRDYARELLEKGKVKYQISYDEDLDVYYVRVGLTPLEEYKIKKRFGEENFNKFIEILKDVILRKEKRKLPESEWWFE